MAGSLRLSDNQFHIAGPATEKARQYQYQCHWSELQCEVERLVMLLSLSLCVTIDPLPACMLGGLRTGQ